MSEKLDHEFAAFQASLKFDRRLVKQDIRGSIAHAEMLALEGILTGNEGQLIVDALSAYFTESGRLFHFQTGRLFH